MSSGIQKMIELNERDAAERAIRKASSITSFTGKHRVFSNFFPASVYILVGTRWVKCPSVEHGFQASKTLSQQWRRKIIEAPSAADAKRMGQDVRRVSYWEEVKIVVMLELLRQKFLLSRKAGRDLLLTSDVKLIEGNTWHDNFWGICECGREGIPGVRDGCTGGLNWLGRLLMRVRKDLMA